MMVNIPLCKLYSNSLLSSLNARGGWKYDDISSLETDSSVAVRFASPSRAYSESKVPGEIARESHQQIKVDASTPIYPDARVKQGVRIHVESFEQRDSIV